MYMYIQCVYIYMYTTETYIHISIIYIHVFLYMKERRKLYLNLLFIPHILDMEEGTSFALLGEYLNEDHKVIKGIKMFTLSQTII